VRIAREGIYGLSQFLKDVLDPVLKLWDVDHLANLSPEAERARIDLEAAIAKLTASVERMAQRLARAAPVLT
jgi:hypothetical protein